MESKRFKVKVGNLKYYHDLLKKEDVDFWKLYVFLDEKRPLPEPYENRVLLGGYN